LPRAAVMMRAKLRPYTGMMREAKLKGAASRFMKTGPTAHLVAIAEQKRAPPRWRRL
jgi:hypothetical protein